MADFYVHDAVVETFLGTNGYGEDTFADPFLLDPDQENGCFLLDSRTIVRDKDGQQVVSESTLFTFPANADRFTPDSRVTYRGNVSLVITTNLNDSRELDLPDHLAVSLK